jgi:DNA-binding NtrC family response regulator
MPGLSGLELLKAVNKMQGELRRIMLVIILSGQHDAKIALELVKNRAFSYQSKPLDIQKLLLDVSRAVTTLT